MATPGDLWWKPGQWGRAMLGNDGVFHSWPEEEGEHYQVAQAKGYRYPEECVMMHIAPDGDVSLGAQANPYQPYIRDLEDEKRYLDEAVSADPRLRYS